MKQILRIGERYAFFAIKRYIGYVLLISLYIILLPGCSAQAQSTNTKHLGIPDGGLKIGDTIPEALWHLPLQVVNHPEGKDTITLNDYRGKLIILDFWATWCTACIVAMPDVHTLEKQFMDSLVVVATTYEPADKADDFLKTNRTVGPLNLISVVNDSTLTHVFPHRFVPHYIWINPGGSICAITDAYAITAAHIRQVLKNDNIALAVKKDQDNTKPLFLSADQETGHLQHYSIFLKGYQAGLGASSAYRYQGDTIVGRCFTNHSLYRLYAAAASALFKERNDQYTRARYIAEVPDSHKLETDNAIPYAQNELYTYDQIVPAWQADSLSRYMLEDLNRYSGYNGRIEQRTVSCLVISDGHKHAPSGSHPASVTAHNLTALINSWSHKTGVPVPDKILVNESSYVGSVGLETVQLKRETELRTALEAYGLTLTDTVRTLNFLVIRKNDPLTLNSASL